MSELKTSPSQLKSQNGGVSSVEYNRIVPTRNAKQGSFSDGGIDMRFTLSGNQSWIPSLSYLRIRLKLSDSAGVQLVNAGDVAFAQNPCSHLFSAAEFQIGSTTVSRISANYPQIDILEKRLGKSKAWMDTVGDSSELLASDFKTRLNATSADGYRLTNNPEDVLNITAAEMRFDAANNTMEIKTAGTATFNAAGGAALPDVRLSFPIGTYVTDAAGVNYLVNGHSASTTVLNVAGAHAAVGAATGFSKTVFGAVKSARAQYIEFCYQPALSIFKLTEKLPAGDYNLNLTPRQASIWGAQIVESMDGKKALGTDYSVSVEDIHLMTCQVSGTRFSGDYYLDMENVRLQTAEIANTSLTSNQFTVSPSCNSITIAYQDNRVSSDSRISESRFRAYPDVLSEAVIRDSSVENKITRSYLEKGSLKVPKIDADPSFVAGTNYQTQRYYESLLNAGQLYNSGGAESFEEWQKNGAFYHYNIVQDGDSNDTRVIVNQQFQDTSDIDTTNILLFDHYSSVAKISIENGKVTTVKVSDM